MSRPAKSVWALALPAVVLSALLLATAAPSGAYVPLRLKLIGKSFGPLLSDGVRWAAYQPTQQTTRIIDGKTGQVVDRPDPTGCARVDSESGLIAVGGGEVLYQCETKGCKYRECPGPGNAYSSARYVVVDVATDREDGEITRVPEGFYGGAVLTGVGSQWTQGVATGMKFGHAVYVNWHTGAFRELAASTTAGIDLNSVGLTRVFCRPVRRVLDLGLYFNPEGPGPEPLYAPPFAIEQREVKVPGFELGSGVEVSLRRCGSRRRDRLPLAGREITSAQVGGGVASWIAPGKNNSAAMYALRLRNRDSRWHGAIYLLYGPKYAPVVGAPQRNGWSLAHTSTAVYQSNVLQEKPEISFSDGLSNIYAARIP